MPNEITKKEILEILEGKCPDLKFTETPSSRCLRFKRKCSQLNCPIRTDLIAGRLLARLERIGEDA